MTSQEKLGKHVKILSEDLDKVIIKIGKIVSIDEFFIELKMSSKTEFIPISKIVRMEVLE